MDTKSIKIKIYEMLNFFIIFTMCFNNMFYCSNHSSLPLILHSVKIVALYRKQTLTQVNAAFHSSCINSLIWHCISIDKAQASFQIETTCLCNARAMSCATGNNYHSIHQSACLQNSHVYLLHSNFYKWKETRKLKIKLHGWGGRTKYESVSSWLSETTKSNFEVS